MDQSRLINKQLTCIKTGSKAKIIAHYDLNNVSYIKVNITMKFEGKKFQVLKTVPTKEIKEQFNYSKTFSKILLKD